MSKKCKSIGCKNVFVGSADFCQECNQKELFSSEGAMEFTDESMSARYPNYYKNTGELTEIDVYATHKLFDIQDPSGCIHHASKKLLLSGVRTGGKSPYQDIKEARDTLTRWLQLNEAENQPKEQRRTTDNYLK